MGVAKNVYGDWLTYVGTLQEVCVAAAGVPMDQVSFGYDGGASKYFAIQKLKRNR